MPSAQTDQWSNIVELLDQAGGHIGIGRMPPIKAPPSPSPRQT